MTSGIDAILLAHIGWELAFPKPARVPDLKEIEAALERQQRREAATWRPKK